MYSEFLSLSILEEIQCLTVSLLCPMSENECLNSSCIATAGNEIFHGRLKSYLARDNTEIRLPVLLVGLFFVKLCVLY